MRVLATSFLALAAACPALADDVYTQAPVAAVTVYPAGAEMVHRATVELPAGTHRVFLPYAGLDGLGSLPRIRTSDGVSIGTLGFQRDMAIDREALFTEAQAAAFGRIDYLTADIAAKDDEIATTGAEAAALKARLAFLGQVAPGEAASGEDIVALADMLQRETQAAQTALVTATAALRPLQEERDELAAALAAAQAEFDRLSPPGDTADLLSVEVVVAEAGPVTLELTELSQSAWWEMDYDLDLDRDAGALDIARKVIVVQETGQTWDGVALTLSTARPGEEVMPSPVSPDQARIHEPITLSRTMAQAESDMVAGAAPMPEPMLADAAMKTAALEVDGLALSYVYPEAVTIAAGEAAELALDALTLDATPAVHASPRYDETAFTVASFTNTAGEPILPGWANILRDGHLVGRQMIELIPAGAETELGFGPIEGIRLDTIFERNAEGDTGLIARSNTRDQAITFTVENLTGEAQQVRAIFPLTYSEQEDLKVKVTASPSPSETDLERQRGVSAWDLTIAPGETAEVSIMVELSWPEGQDLAWYP
ncbi:DUF4139 domain-containing protein [Sinisalibacter aestuarii]|uniref:Mucoidy inhibitor MuiA family protein n=1 Tax=Sinisalibacter aestuarii TaxID=2949426 RepID=A0ABQ5LMN6_9RHOB|nr:DUF4139 domain-containing protein [Sinisalibacter aestuarii]GKY86284.1 hypothetical protein STA1M1_01530 [Sinisalibacter aestuarii]